MPSPDSLDNEGENNIKLLLSASKSNFLLAVEIEFETWTYTHKDWVWTRDGAIIVTLWTFEIKFHLQRSWNYVPAG